MERFTRESDGYFAVRSESCYEDQNEDYCGPAIDRLAAYEDTGLTPKDVVDLMGNHGMALSELAKVPKWIPVTERLPENEVEVLILAERRYCSIEEPSRNAVQIVAKAFHTDGKMNTEDSGHTWELWDTGADYDEEADANIIPEGWWESVDYGEEFAAVDDFVTHWMPLPKPPRKDVGK